jgi:hypothetical protein
MADEIELKFDVAPLELRKLKVAWARSRRPKEEKLVSIYFDTPKQGNRQGDDAHQIAFAFWPNATLKRAHRSLLNTQSAAVKPR